MGYQYSELFVVTGVFTLEAEAKLRKPKALMMVKLEKVMAVWGRAEEEAYKDERCFGVHSNGEIIGPSAEVALANQMWGV